jgi:FMN-dependent NADH-azoreductase
MEGSKHHVLGLSCSPRARGNTDLMCDSALAGAAAAGGSVEKIRVPSLNINPCKECNACFKTGQCVQKDDMPELLEKMLSAEGIILAAPIFSMNLAAQAKIMIDRLQCWAKKYVLKEHTVPDQARSERRGLWLSAAGMDKPRVFETAVPTVRYFFGILEVPSWERVLYHHVDEKGAIAGVSGALEECGQAGARLVVGPLQGGPDG